MLSANTTHNTSIRFRRWTRKNYAVFASLHKTISIGNVVINICNQALKKIKQQNTSLHFDFERFSDIVESNKTIDEVILEYQLVASSTVTTGETYQNTSLLNINHLSNNIF